MTSKLIELVPGLAARDTEEAWDRFLGEYASLILQVVHLFERDQDRIEDCFLFVCEQLKRGRLRRLRRFQTDGAASFPTWLRAVVRNLCLDWRRKRWGRPRIFRSIARLPELDQEVFRCIYFRKLSENETYHTIKALYPAVGREDLADSLTRIRRSLSPHQSWLLVSRNPFLEPLSAEGDFGDGGHGPRELSDPHQNPENEAARQEYLAALREAMALLSPSERLLLHLRFEQDLSLDEISDLMQLGTPQRAQRGIRNALSTIRQELVAKGVSSVSVKDLQPGGKDLVWADRK